MSRYFRMAVPAGLLLLAAGLPAQLNRGVITGTVSDVTGSVIPGVEVTIRNTANNSTHDTTTNEAGIYNAPNLPVGPYVLIFQTPGMKRLERSGISVSVAEVLRVNAVLEIGEVTESIEITAEASRIQTDTPAVATSLSNKELTDLPLSFSGFRHIENFAYKVSPGVTGGTWTSHINGSTSFSKEVVMDGAPLTTYLSGDTSSSSLSIEAVQEFKIQTSGLSAEFGRTQGGTFNYVLKSGTNQFHGSGYGALRNEALNANSFGNNFFGRKRNLDRKNAWAASLGGPIVRDRTFFYVAYEHYSQNELTYGSPNQTVPLPEFYDGNLSRLLGGNTNFTDALGRPVRQLAIYDPLSFEQLPNGRWIGEPFAGNIIPLARISRVARTYNDLAKQSILPAVVDANGVSPVQNNNFHPSGIPSYPYRPLSIKADQILSDAHKLSGSFTYIQQGRYLLDGAQHAWSLTEPLGGPLGRIREQTLNGHFIRLAEDWTVSPNGLNHITLFYNRYVNVNKKNPNPEAHVDGAAILGFTNFTRGDCGYPVINWGGGPIVNIANTGSSQCDSTTPAVAFGLIDTFSFIKGKHVIKVGVDIRRTHYNQRQSSTPTFTFDARATSIPNEPFSGNQAGHAFASYLLGIVDSAGFTDPVGFGQRRSYYSVFIQDDYKVSPRLTMNAGLRWDYQPPGTEVADRYSSWNPTKTDPQTGLPGAYDFAGDCDVCTGKNYFGTRKPFRGFGPRLGIAYRVTDRWSLRAAYGILFEPDTFNNFGMPLGKASSVQAGGTYNLASLPVDPWRGVFNWDNGVPLAESFIPPSYDLSWGNTNTPGRISDDYGKTGYSQQWNFNLQREFGPNLLLDLGYVGTKATGLRSNTMGNNANLNLNQIPTESLAQYGTALTRVIRNAADAAANGVGYPYPGFVGTVASALRQYPQVRGNDRVNVYGAPIGFVSHHAFQVTVNRRFANGFTAFGNYVWSKTLTNTNSAPLDVNRLANEKALANYDIPHAVKLYAEWELPGRGQLLGGWSISAILNYFSGTPLSFTGQSPLPGAWNGGANRINIAPGDLTLSNFDASAFNLADLDAASNTFLNKNVFSHPNALEFGTASQYHGGARNFASLSEDLGIRKDFRIREGIRAQIRAEFLNAFNRHQLGSVQTDVRNSQFGQVRAANGNRTVQLSARFDF